MIPDLIFLHVLQQLISLTLTHSSDITPPGPVAHGKKYIHVYSTVEQWL